MNEIEQTDQTDREEILELLEETIKTTHKHIEPGEADSLEEQHLQIKWIRTFGYLTGQYRRLLKDEDIDQLHEDADLVNRVLDLRDP
ncbi:hypothetical protein [Natronococcus occultus]|uniref:DUF8136 domain-containing protein n=1 Tax=Natronococcus occultus SP4 TaxID=694430 RepID=L0K394_9EURY|nr:hypothetical protein [Natronococcus occultus]AGB38799.1 hypothetical protein Natoc_3055 [Natronococcus occultus SP4]